MEALIPKTIATSEEEINEKLDVLRTALSTGHNTIVKEALMRVVPTYHTPEEVNGKNVSSFC